MPLRPAPTRNGLVVPPRTFECIGPRDCPVIAKKGKCFKDRHHLYFPWNIYEEGDDPLLKAFHKDVHNIKPMARCRHNSSYEKAMHSRYSIALVPDEDIMVTFLDESAHLESMAKLTTKMAGLTAKLICLGMSDASTMLSRPYEELSSAGMAYSDKLRLVTSFEVMPVADVARDIASHAERLQYVMESGFGPLLIAA